jgi:hypothetical protein
MIPSVLGARSRPKRTVESLTVSASKQQDLISSNEGRFEKTSFSKLALGFSQIQIKRENLLLLD